MIPHQHQVTISYRINVCISQLYFVVFIYAMYIYCWHLVCEYFALIIYVAIIDRLEYASSIFLYFFYVEIVLVFVIY
jgi:hypothetical protein